MQCPSESSTGLVRFRRFSPRLVNCLGKLLSLLRIRGFLWLASPLLSVQPHQAVTSAIRPVLLNHQPRQTTAADQPARLNRQPAAVHRLLRRQPLRRQPHRRRLLRHPPRRRQPRRRLAHRTMALGRTLAGITKIAQITMIWIRIITSHRGTSVIACSSMIARPSSSR